MNRKDFLNRISLGAAFALTAGCLGSCNQDEISPSQPVGEVDFTLNLDSSSNAALLANGGYVIANRVVVAKDNNGEFVAASQRCSHEGLDRVIMKNNEWYCPEHGAKFSLDGMGLNKDGSKGLTVYKTALSGTMLRIYS